VVQSEFRRAADFVDRVGGGAGPGGAKAVAPTGTEPVSITIPEEEQQVSILGEKVTVERLDGTARLPHMGWNDVEPVGPPHPLAAGLPACAYFAHSYAVRDAGPAAVAETEVDGQRFTSVVAAGRVAGAQFHPERSAGAGLAMLRGFLAWSDAA